MGQNQIVGFKLSYCLGIGDTVLQSSYARLYNLASELRYFAGKMHAYSYRAFCKIYFLLLRHYELYSKTDSILAVAKGRFDPYLEGIKFDLDLLRSSFASFDEFVNFLAKRANDELAEVYKEMEFGLDFDDFLLLLHLPDLSHAAMLQTQFLLHQQPSQFNVYFFNNAVFNVNPQEMLLSDMVLTRRLGLATGTRRSKRKDESSLGIEMLKQDDSAFLAVSETTEFYRILIDTSTVSDLAKQLLLSTAEGKSKITLCENCEDCLAHLQDGSSPSNTLVVLHAVASKLDTLVDVMERSASLLVTMPVPHATYHKILRGLYPNTYLFSMREAKAEALI